MRFAPADTLQVGVVPGLRPRLITGAGDASDPCDRESLARYRADGGYRLDPPGDGGDQLANRAERRDNPEWFGLSAVNGSEDLLDLIEASGLRGRGGASFPTARKLRAVRAGAAQAGSLAAVAFEARVVEAGAGRPVIVANGEEGEPTSVKDRWLLRHRPHLVIDGLCYAAASVGADLAYVYVSDRQAELSVTEAATAALDEGLLADLELRVVRTEPGYVAGEETAAVRFLNGGPALPTDKPPRPYESGVAGRPTLVSNVETLANLPVLARLGVDGYRAVGPEHAPGTFLMTLGGRCARAGLYEVPLGMPLGVAIEALGGTPDPPVGFLFGGYFGGLLNERGLKVPLDYDSLAAAGSGLGCGSVIVLGPQDCPVQVAAEVMAYFARENAGQCGSCFNGTAAMSGILSAMVAGTATELQVARLRHLSGFLRRRGACGTLDGAAQLAMTVLREFPEATERHLREPCRLCRAAGPMSLDPPFGVTVPGGRLSGLRTCGSEVSEPEGSGSGGSERSGSRTARTEFRVERRGS